MSSIHIKRMAEGCIKCKDLCQFFLFMLYPKSWVSYEQKGWEKGEGKGEGIQKMERLQEWVLYIL
jgi:hypothetical protein